MKKQNKKKKRKKSKAGRNQPKGNRVYKDSLFRFMFSDKESVLELYNAIEGTNYGMDTEVEFTTLENVLYVESKNDIGFSIAGKYVVLTEHQSTINNNMPLRFLDYVTQTYKKMINKDDFFKRGAVPILTPEFFVIYTGKDNWDKQELRLSDSFVGEIPENSLELVVKIIDVRYNRKEAEEILSRSKKLRGYSILLDYVEQYRKEEYQLEYAIDKAVNRCIDEDILRDFLLRYGKEARQMLCEGISAERFAEIRAAEEGAVQRAEGREEGRAEGEAAMQERMNKLFKQLNEQGRIDDYVKSTEDKSFQQQLFEEFGL